MLPTHEPLNPSLAQLLRNHLAPITPLQFCPSTALLQVQVQNCLLPRLSWKNLHEPRRRRAAQSQGSSLGKAPRSFAASRLVFIQRTWSAAPRNCILCCAVAVFGIVGPRCCVHKEFHRARSTPRAATFTKSSMIIVSYYRRPGLCWGTRRKPNACMWESHKNMLAVELVCFRRFQDRAKVHIESDFCWRRCLVVTARR